jgi:hypothetical protein
MEYTFTLYARQEKVVSSPMMVESKLEQINVHVWLAS